MEYKWRLWGVLSVDGEVKFGTRLAVITSGTHASNHPKPSYPGQHCSVWSSCRVRRAEEALVQGKHRVGLCTGGMKHDPQNTSHECCFCSRDGKNSRRSAAVPKQGCGCGLLTPPPSPLHKLKSILRSCGPLCPGSWIYTRIHGPGRPDPFDRQGTE